MTYEDQRSLKEPLISEKEDPVDKDEGILSRRSLREANKQFALKSLSSLRPAHLYRLGKRFAYALTPQLVRTHVWDEKAPKSKVFPTSYLNGLRGMASVKVFTFHYTHFYSDSTTAAWGVDERHRHFLELPIIRYFYAGTTAHVFFGCAGYLTTLRLAQQMDKQDPVSRAKVLVNVSGAIFRRALRLYLPTLIITFITTHFIYFGLYEQNRQYFGDKKLFPGPFYEPRPNQYPTYYEQLHNWAHEMIKLSDIFQYGYRPEHDCHLWSILAEMQGSLLSYLIMIATAQCRHHIRLGVMCVMLFMLFLWNRWDICVYILGGIVGQVDAILIERDQQKKMTLSPESPTISTFAESGKMATVWSRFRATPHSVLSITGFLVSFYLMSYPTWGYGSKAFGYQTLNQFIPHGMAMPEKFYPVIGTGLLLFMLARSDPKTSVWRKLLNTDLFAYLGKVSFALYLLHGPILHGIGYMIPHYIWWSFGVQGAEVGDIPWTVVIVIGWAIGLGMCLWAADVWSREVEGRCTKVVKKLEDFCFVKA
ncbi:hypothetical protein RBB50_000713 [Rhinocladiella similis]